MGGILISPVICDDGARAAVNANIYQALQTDFLLQLLFAVLCHFLHTQ